MTNFKSVIPAGNWSEGETTVRVGRALERRNGARMIVNNNPSVAKRVTVTGIADFNRGGVNLGISDRSNAATRHQQNNDANS